MPCTTHSPKLNRKNILNKRSLSIWVLFYDSLYRFLGRWDDYRNNFWLTICFSSPVAFALLVRIGWISAICLEFTSFKWYKNKSQLPEAFLSSNNNHLIILHFDKYIYSKQQFQRQTKDIQIQYDMMVSVITLEYQINI